MSDINFLYTGYSKSNLKFPFDYHFFNIWGLFFAYLANRNLLKSKKDFGGFNLEILMEMFGIKNESLHDALEDCRVEAEILRHIMKELNK